MTPARWLALALFCVSIACVIGIINGMYSMEMLVDSGGGMGATAIEAKTSRAMAYGAIALATAIGGVALTVADWLRGPRR
ncbi:hypothetical protein ACFWGD_10645 [Corynebacterium sp. NPDC060344]|uniref:hypothetical protein n=1 Tax=Corynebacterium sp. NPDC060344 TaxID=3347101 RepID=UPI00365A2B5B